MENFKQILDKFILQSKTRNLKTKGLYPETLLDLKFKVSFGMGNVAAVSWMSILGPGMSTSNGYYPVYLYYKSENTLVLAYGISEHIEYENPWSREIIDSSERASKLFNKKLRYRDSWVFKSYIPRIDGKNVFYSINDNEIHESDIESDLVEIVNQYKKCLDIQVKDESSQLSKGLFYMESQLEDFIIQNWSKTQFGKKYDLIIKDGELLSQQYRTDIGRIDILAKKKSNNSYVVIELKRNQTSDDTIGQLTRYMGWIKEKFNDNNVSGIIVAGDFDNKLDYARKMIPNIEIFKYQVDFKLSEFS